MRILKGLVAGAAGTLALNFLTYMDMLLRGRPPSKLPEQAAEPVLKKAKAVIGGGESDDKDQNRRSALGALMGYSTGLGIGGFYAILTSHKRASGVSPLVAGPALGAAAMLATDAPMVKIGLTDPRTWSTTDWLADLVPHLGYGIVTTGVYRMLVR